MCKLQHFVALNSFLTLYSAFLSDRQQSVQYKAFKLERYAIVPGASEDYGIGLLLFLFFVNYLLLCVRDQAIYEDDIKIFTAIYNFAEESFKYMAKC